jgi:protein TonB
MTSKEILQASLADILFENRNKSYGAYVLRKDYNRRLGMSLFISMFSAFILFLISIFKNNASSVGINKSPDDVLWKVYNLPQEIKPPAIKFSQEKSKAIKNISRIQIVPDDVPSDMPAQHDLTEATPGSKSGDGPPSSNTGDQLLPEKETTADVMVSQNDMNNPFIPEEQPPLFPGGIAEWLKFLRNNLRSPADLGDEQQRIVRVRFWIDADGIASRFEIVQSGGSAFDKEVIRVMKKMPRWQPAVQNNRKVAVSYIQPIIFMTEEE